MIPLAAPFPWFGGKRRVAPEVWRRFGTVANYVEPFFGSGAVLLGRPQPIGLETVNDKDGFVANFWRAIRDAPDEVAAWADWPVNENDLHARHAWLVTQREELVCRLEGDPEWYDAKIAGYWAWGISCWIGSEFCSGAGSWHICDGRLVKLDAGEQNGDSGPGVKRSLPHLGDAGNGVHRPGASLQSWFQSLADRLRQVRVCCGDWTRVLTPSVTVRHGLTAVFLDPPYSDLASRDSHIYAEECLQVAHAVREWAIANGENPLLRIALCGYEGEHTMPDTWTVYAWTAHGGYSNLSGNKNKYRERIWFSPHCVQVDDQLSLYESGQEEHHELGPTRS